MMPGYGGGYSGTAVAGSAAAGFVGGMLLSVTSTAAVATALALPLTFCGVQDMRSFIAALNERGHTRGTQYIAACSFALAFPCGALMACSLYLGVRGLWPPPLLRVAAAAALPPLRSPQHALPTRPSPTRCLLCVPLERPDLPGGRRNRPIRRGTGYTSFAPSWQACLSTSLSFSWRRPTPMRGSTT